VDELEDEAGVVGGEVTEDEPVGFQYGSGRRSHGRRRWGSGWAWFGFGMQWQATFGVRSCAVRRSRSLQAFATPGVDFTAHGARLDPKTTKTTRGVQWHRNSYM